MQVKVTSASCRFGDFMLSELPAFLWPFLLPQTLQASHSEVKITLSWDFSGLVHTHSRERTWPHPAALLPLVSMDQVPLLSHPLE